MIVARNSGSQLKCSRNLELRFFAILSLAGQTHLIVNQELIPEVDLSPERKIDFKAPPVVETTWTVFFAPLVGWTALSAGMFWDRVRSDYPDAHLVNPVGRIEVSEFPSISSDEIELERLPIRCKLMSENRNQMLQVQANSFRRSWRATEQYPKYQHYDETKPLFEADWDRFIRFLGERRIAAPSVWQSEVTYINHLEKGREWQDFTDLPGIFRWDSLCRLAPLSNRNLAAFAFSYMSDSGSRLEIDSQLAARKKDGRELLQLRISSFNLVKAPSTEYLQAAIALGHSDVIETFVAITSEKMQHLWDRL